MARSLGYVFGNTVQSVFEHNLVGRQFQCPLKSRADRVGALKQVKAYLKAQPSGIIQNCVTQIERSLGATLRLDSNPPPIYQSLNWDQVREMQQSGLVDFGAHTHTHSILARCDQESMKTELTVCREIIEAHTLQPCKLFCYPNGGPGDFSNETEEVLRKLGFSSALTTVAGFNTRQTNVFQLLRIGVPDTWDESYFILKMSGALRLLQGTAG